MNWSIQRAQCALLLLSLAIVPAVAADLPSECTLQGATTIVDKLEAVVISGAGEFPFCSTGNCCITSKFKQIHIVTTQRKYSVWARLVMFDQLDTGIANRELNVGLVDERGREISPDIGHYSVKNGRVRTDQYGFSYLPTTFEFSELAPIGQIFLVRFSYSDSSTVTKSYGPYFYIASPIDEEENLRSKLSEKGFWLD
jgi:hypothetical protein